MSSIDFVSLNEVKIVRDLSNSILGDFNFRSKIQLGHCSVHIRYVIDLSISHWFPK